MALFVIWIDRAHAKIFHFSSNKMERSTVKFDSPNHHTHRLDQKDHERSESRLFHSVADQATPADQILILGPGVAKYHFQTFLSEQRPFLFRKVVGCETVDHPTDPQIAAYAKKFFKLDAAYSSEFSA